MDSTIKKSDFDLYKPLPQNILPGPNLTARDEQSQHITNLLQQTLPNSEAKIVKQELNWHFTLEKHSIPCKKKQRGKRKRRPTEKKIRLVDTSHEIERPPTGWRYEELLPIRDMWREYIKRCIGKPVAHYKDESSSLRVILGKCEFIGAPLCVERSTVPNMVGMNGIVIKETKSLMEIITQKSQRKKIPKNVVILTFDVGHVQLTVIGKHLMTRPAERSVKKMKSMLFADI